MEAKETDNSAYAGTQIIPSDVCVEQRGTKGAVPR